MQTAPRHRRRSPAARPKKRPAPSKRTPPNEPAQEKKPSRVKRPVAALVPSAPLDFERIDGTRMFDTLGRVRALPKEEASRAILARSVAKMYGYSRAELFAVADVGRQYLESGGYRLAALIFDGLAAIDPDEPYFAMALGLTRDHLGDKKAAMDAYRRARKLDPKDPRSEINIAELLVERGERKKAVAHLRAARKKACAAAENALLEKADGLLSLLGAHR